MLFRLFWAPKSPIWRVHDLAEAGEDLLFVAREFLDQLLPLLGRPVLHPSERQPDLTPPVFRYFPESGHLADEVRLLLGRKRREDLGAPDQDFLLRLGHPVKPLQLLAELLLHPRRQLFEGAIPLVGAGPVKARDRAPRIAERRTHLGSSRSAPLGASPPDGGARCVLLVGGPDGRG